MPIEFDRTNDQRVVYGTATQIDNLTAYTLMARINADAIVSGEAPRFFDKLEEGTNNAGSAFGVYNGVSARNNNLFFVAGWDDTQGEWETGTNTITAGTEHHVAVSYDHTNVANNPIFYIDGIVSTAFEILTPVGSVGNDTEDLYAPGSHSGAFPESFDGLLSDWRIYNRIVSAVDIKSVADSNSISVSGHGFGLVFHVQGIGASGLQSYEGVALSASNIVRDRINGLAGVPNLSPVGHDEVLRGVRL